MMNIKKSIFGMLATVGLVLSVGFGCTQQEQGVAEAKGEKEYFDLIEITLTGTNSGNSMKAIVFKDGGLRVYPVKASIENKFTMDDVHAGKLEGAIDSELGQKVVSEIRFKNDK